MLRYIKIISAVIIAISLICILFAPVIIDGAQNIYKKNHIEKIKLIDKIEYSEVSSEIYVPDNWSYLQYIYAVVLAVGVFFEVCAPRYVVVFGVILVICEIITLYKKITKRGSSN